MYRLAACTWGRDQEVHRRVVGCPPNHDSSRRPPCESSITALDGFKGVLLLLGPLRCTTLHALP